jgi:hypothetical protein
MAQSFQQLSLQRYIYGSPLVAVLIDTLQIRVQNLLSIRLALELAAQLNFMNDRVRAMTNLLRVWINAAPVDREDILGSPRFLNSGYLFELLDIMPYFAANPLFSPTATSIPHCHFEASAMRLYI